jgi:hypothetical protein
MRVRLNRSEIDRIAESPELAGELGKVAQRVLPVARASAPGWLDAQWLTRAGVGPRGAFGQAIARGSGTILAEYGGTNSPAHGFMRRALRQIVGR